MFPFPAPAILKPLAVAPTLGSFTWNTSDAYGGYKSFSNSNKTLNQPDGNDYANARATSAIANFIARVNIDAFAAEFQFGLILLSTSMDRGGSGLNAAPGNYLYSAGGNIFKNGSRVGTSTQAPALAPGDTASVSADASTVTFYKNNTVVYTTGRTSGDSGALYPCISLLQSQATLTP